MATYSFEAITADGTSRTGVLNADSARSARTQLRAQGLVPLMVEPATTSATAGTGRHGWRRTFSSSDLSVWTRQLAGLLVSGLTLERALATLETEMERPAQRAVVAALRAEVNAGASFGAALGQHPREFPEIYRAVISAGEQSGALGQVLEHLADDLEKQQQLRGKLVSAAIYPAIVTVIAILIVTFLVTYVVPQIAGVFAGSRHTLPLLTRLMIGLSSFLRQWGWLVLIVLAAGSALFTQLLKQPAVRASIDALRLRLPLLGRLERGYNAARFAATLALLANAGVPIIRALQAAADTLSNRAMRADALEALAVVREGAPIASSLAVHQRFPPLLIMFIRLGEQTGQLPAMLQRGANQLGEDTQRRAMQLATVLEPLLIAGMGLVVMLIVLAVLMPIIELNQMVR